MKYFNEKFKQEKRMMYAFFLYQAPRSSLRVYIIKFIFNDSENLFLQTYLIFCITTWQLSLQYLSLPYVILIKINDALCVYRSVWLESASVDEGKQHEYSSWLKTCHYRAVIAIVFDESFENLYRHWTKLALLVWIHRIHHASGCCICRN